MKKYIVHVYLGLIVLYYGQGSVFPDSGIAGKLILAAVIVMSLYYWIYAATNYKMPRPLRILNTMLVIWTIYGAIPILLGSTEAKSIGQGSYYYLKNIYSSMLPIYAFYIFCKRGLLTEKITQIWFFIFLGTAIVGFFFNEQLRISLIAEGGRDVSEITNNAGYTMASLLCLIPLFYKKPLLQYFLMGICLYFVLIGFKRGAIICGALCAILIIYRSFKMNDSFKREKVKTNWRRILLTIALFAAAVYAVNMLIATSDYFNYRLEATIEGRTSQRDDIYTFFYEHFTTEANLFTFLFGNGAYGTVELYGKFAHNDWLEIAIDNGFIFLILYVVYWVSILITVNKGDKKSIYTLMLSTFVIIYLFRTFMSMSYSAVTPYASLAFGMALANYQYKTNTRDLSDYKQYI